MHLCKTPSFNVTKEPSAMIRLLLTLAWNCVIYLCSLSWLFVSSQIWINVIKSSNFSARADALSCCLCLTVITQNINYNITNVIFYQTQNKFTISIFILSNLIWIYLGDFLEIHPKPHTHALTMASEPIQYAHIWGDVSIFSHKTHQT